MYHLIYVECLQIVWLWLGYTLQRTEKNLLRNFRLCRSGNLRRKRIRYECGSVVFGCAHLRTADRQGTILSLEQKGNHEEDFECRDWIYHVSWNYVLTGCRFHWEADQEGSEWEDEGCWCAEASLSQECWGFMIIFKENTSLLISSIIIYQISKIWYWVRYFIKIFRQSEFWLKFIQLD